DAVGFLTGGAGGAPDIERAIVAPALDQVRDHHGAQRFERVVVAEEQRLRGDHRLDDLPIQAVAWLRAHLRDQFAERVQLEPAHDGRQARFDQIALVRVQGDGAALQQESANDIEVQVGHEGADGHPAPPGAAAPGEAIAADTRRTISSPIRESGSTRSASPARATWPGMPQTTDVASSWTRICPPAARIASQPRRPSCPMPVRITVSEFGPTALATER